MQTEASLFGLLATSVSHRIVRGLPPLRSTELDSVPDALLLELDERVDLALVSGAADSGGNGHLTEKRRYEALEVALERLNQAPAALPSLLLLLLFFSPALALGILWSVARLSVLL